MIKITLTFFCLLINSVYNENQHLKVDRYTPDRDSIPGILTGNFIDDYGIRYKISRTKWIQYPNTTYHIIRCNKKDQFLVAKNDAGNAAGPGLYTKIHYTTNEMQHPYVWGFCLSVYDAKSDSLAEVGYSADIQNPRKGCNSFPFSRMKKN